MPLDADAMQIRLDLVDSEPVLALLREHLEALAPTAPVESRHALGVAGLRAGDVTVWTIWDATALAGIGALKRLNTTHAEIKSMRTTPAYQRRGVASAMLRHLVAEAVGRGYTTLSLETGSMDYFEPARRLYGSFGFAPCPPFGDYRADPNSVFMNLQLDAGGLAGCLTECPLHPPRRR